jgi:hypothetical protein
MESRLTNVHTRNGHPVSLITDKKRQEPTRSVKKGNTPTRKKNIPTRKKNIPRRKKK